MLGGDVVGTYELEYTLECIYTKFSDRTTANNLQIYTDGIKVGHDYIYPTGYEYRVIAYGLKHPDGLTIEDIKKVTARLYFYKYTGEGYVTAGPIGYGTTAEDSLERRWAAVAFTNPSLQTTATEGSGIEDIEITDTEEINNLFVPTRGFGLKGVYLTEESKEDNYVELTKIEFIAEYKDKYTAPTINLRKDLMTNGGFYPEDRAMDYYQYVDRPFSISWDYEQEAGAIVKDTKIYVRTLATNDGTPTQDWEVIQYTYSGNTGTVIIPDYVWKRIPCGGWVQITVTSEMDKSASFQMWFDVPFHKTEILFPAKDSILKCEDTNKLGWEIQEISGFIAFPAVSGYQILLSTNEGATYDLVAEITGDTREFTFGEETLPIGIIYVRVVAMYDNNTVEQNLQYGESRYIVAADPETSTITCDGKPVPTISWESVAQTSYQVKFGDYDSGTVYSSEKSHRVPYFFADGVYEVTVRTQISTGEWSEWSEPIYVQITNTAPGLGITATAERSGFRVKIVWTKNSGYTDYIVYRNGVPIHVTDGGISTEGGYMDNMANGLSLYMVRGITADGYYDQSETVTVDASWDTDILFALGTDEILPLKYTPSFPRSYNYASEMSVTYRYFAGRPKPIAITSGQVSRTLPLSYIDRGRTLARKLAGMIGQTVVFKDSGGDMIIGILNMVNAGMGRMTSTTTFQITEVDYNERVEYIPGE